MVDFPMCSRCNTYARLDRVTLCKQCKSENDKSLRLKRKEIYLEQASDIVKICRTCSFEKSGIEFASGRTICKPCSANESYRLKLLCEPKETDPHKSCSRCSKVQDPLKFRRGNNICNECEKERLYQWRKEHPEKFQAVCARYRAKPDYREKQNNYKRSAYILQKLVKQHRNRLRLFLKKGESKNFQDVLNCSIAELRDWLEYNMDTDMNWDNYGTYWHIDHITPCRSFDFSKANEIRKCFHWSNLAPLQAQENLKKHAKIIPSMQKYYQNRAMEYIKLLKLNPDEYLLGALATKEDQ